MKPLLKPFTVKPLPTVMKPIFKQKKICMSLYYSFHGEDGRIVLDLSLVLFIKSELLCRHFTLFDPVSKIYVVCGN